MHQPVARRRFHRLAPGTREDPQEKSLHRAHHNHPLTGPASHPVLINYGRTTTRISRCAAQKEYESTQRRGARGSDAERERERDGRGEGRCGVEGVWVLTAPPAIFSPRPPAPPRLRAQTCLLPFFSVRSVRSVRSVVQPRPLLSFPLRALLPLRVSAFYRLSSRFLSARLCGDRPLSLPLPPTAATR
jgi:hypothetical protein